MNDVGKLWVVVSGFLDQGLSGDLTAGVRLIDITQLSSRSASTRGVCGVPLRSLVRRQACHWHVSVHSDVSTFMGDHE